MNNTYFKKLIKSSKPIKAQFHNSGDNNNYDIEAIPFGGRLKHKELSSRFERLYGDRVVIRAIDTCPYICSFCYEKPKITTKYRELSQIDINKAIEFIKNDQEINNVLVSGGSPLLLEFNTLRSILTSLFNIENVGQIYLAGGRPIFDPNIYTDELANLIASFNTPNETKPYLSKKIGLSIHINHPDELTVIPPGEKMSVIKAITRFTSKGVLVYSQSTVLKGINDEKDIIEELCFLFSKNNILPYYFLHPLDTPWENRFRIPVNKFLELASHMSKFSGHVNPRFIIATPIGKITITGVEKLSTKKINNKNYVKLQTCYKKSDYIKYNRLETLPPNVDIDNGYMSIYYPDY